VSLYSVHYLYLDNDRFDIFDALSIILLTHRSIVPKQHPFIRAAHQIVWMYCACGVQCTDVSESRPNGFSTITRFHPFYHSTNIISERWIIIVKRRSYHCHYMFSNELCNRYKCSWWNSKIEDSIDWSSVLDLPFS
jgi:hypothetical protein